MLYVPNLVRVHRSISRDKETNGAHVFAAFQFVAVGAGAVGEIREAALIKDAGHFAHLARGHAVQVNIDNRTPKDSIVRAHFIHGSGDIVLLFLLA